MNPLKNTHDEEVQNAGKEYLNDLLEKSEKNESEKSAPTDKLNKKRHARYNFNTDDIVIDKNE